MFESLSYSSVTTPLRYVAASALALSLGLGTPAGAKEVDDEEATPFATPELNVPEADTQILGFIDSRDAVSLNGTWNLIVDPMGVGSPGGFFGGWASARTPANDWTLMEYSYHSSRQVRVPGDFNTQFEDLFFYRDGVWYQRFFDAKPVSGKRYHLWFGGSNYETTVFLNGEPVTHLKGGYVPFSVDVTDELLSGENDLVVRVNNRLGEDTVPTARTDWWPYGGLVRDVMLVETPDQYLLNAKFDLSKSKQGIEGSVQGRGFKSGDTVQVSVPALNVNVSAKFDSHGKAVWRADSKPALWSPESPVLYDVVIAAGDDRLVDRVGFRTIETKGTTILLNGEPIRFKGISTHEEPIGREGAAYSKADMAALFSEAKALGVNFIRAAHYPYNRYAAQLADEMGLLLWEEAPVYWNIQWENPETLAIARDQLSRLVQRDWNRASVVVWSVANETPYSEPRMKFLGQLIDDVRGLDGSRLVSAALLGDMRRELKEAGLHLAAYGVTQDWVSAEERKKFQTILDAAGEHAPSSDAGFNLVIDDPLGELVDIVSYNEYFGWYYARGIAPAVGVDEKTIRKLMFQFMPHVTIGSAFDKPMHISEFGAGAKAGKRGDGVWTEDYQAEVYRAQTTMLANSPQVQGMTPWILKDFRAMLRSLPGIQDYRNRKGLIDENGRRKLAFYVLRDFYQGEWAGSVAAEAQE